jgi:hypothetical protein
MRPSLAPGREMTFARREGAPRRPATTWGRAVALLAAGAISLALMLDPYILNGASALRVHEGLPLLMIGVSSAFAYGLGLRAFSLTARILLHPALAWALMGVGAALMLLP